MYASNVNFVVFLRLHQLVRFYLESLGWIFLLEDYLWYIENKQVEKKRDTGQCVSLRGIPALCHFGVDCGFLPSKNEADQDKPLVTHSINMRLDSGVSRWSGAYCSTARHLGGTQKLGCFLQFSYCVTLVKSLHVSGLQSPLNKERLRLDHVFLNLAIL